MMSRLHREQEGVTLVELLVVIVVLGVISGIVLTGTVSALESSRKTQARVTALSDLTKGLERISRELRAADPLDLSQVPTVADAPYEVGAKVFRDGNVFTYRYYLTTVDGVPQLREDVKVCPTSDPDCTSTTPLAGSGNGLFIVDTVNAELVPPVPLLTYYDDDGVELDCTGLALSDCQALLASAEQVKLTLVRSLPEQSPISVETYINVRRARFS